jgi:phosphatidylserine/phosphatidylglycerophosphate/cardiolipin synthase-like enzyme
VYDLENSAGTPIYVHAKVCVVDDEWFTCGSDNFNRRSWTNDSELTCAVVGDGLARSVRAELWSEHLESEPELDPVKGFEQWQAAAEALDSWHAGGEVGPRPPGRLRRHEPVPVGRLAKVWAPPIYHHLYDPDGRPRRMRWRNSF